MNNFCEGKKKKHKIILCSSQFTESYELEGISGEYLVQPPQLQQGPLKRVTQKYI